MPVKNPKTGKYENWSVYSNNVSLAFALYTLLLAIAAAANQPGGYALYENKVASFVGYAAGSFFGLILLTVAPAYITSEILLRRPTVVKWVIASILFLLIAVFTLIRMLSINGLLEL